MTNDRRRFIKTGLGGLAGLTSLPLLGSLGGCQHAPARKAAGNASKAQVPATRNLPVAKVTDRVSVITDAPPELVEDIWFRPGIWPNCRSSGAVIDEVITSGLAPGYSVTTWIVG